jgi:hypothetical protein
VFAPCDRVTIRSCANMRLSVPITPRMTAITRVQICTLTETPRFSSICAPQSNTSNGPLKIPTENATSPTYFSALGNTAQERKNPYQYPTNNAASRNDVAIEIAAARPAAQCMAGRVRGPRAFPHRRHITGSCCNPQRDADGTDHLGWRSSPSVCIAPHIHRANRTPTQVSRQDCSSS